MRKLTSSLLLLLAAQCIFASTTVTATSWREVADFSLTLSAEHTDNRDSVADDADVSKESTWDMMLSPRLNLNHGSGPLLLSLRYEPTFRHRTNPRQDQNENQWLHLLTARFDHGTGRRLSSRLENWFTYTDDPEVSEGEQILRSNRSFFRNRVTLGANYDLTGRMDLDLEGGYELKRYEDGETADLSDENRYRAQVRLQRLHSSRFGYSALFRVLRVERQDMLDLDRGLDSYWAGAGLRHFFARRLLAEMDAGMQWVEYEDSQLTGESSPFVRGQLVYHAAANTKLRAGGSYTIAEAYNFPYISQDLLSLYGGIELELLPRITVGARSEYRLEQYESRKADPDTPEPAFLGDRDGDTRRILLSGWVDVELRDGLNLRLGHSHEDVDSDVSPSFSRGSTRVHARVSF